MESTAHDDTLRSPPRCTWKILIADDEPLVHEIIHSRLARFSFAGNPLQFLNTTTIEETRETLRINPETVGILLSLNMGGEESGSDLVRWIREELRNTGIRIILLTDSPHADKLPESSLMQQYEIHDYREKRKLTAHKLHTLLTGTLRSYQSIQKHTFQQELIHTLGEATENRGTGTARHVVRVASISTMLARALRLNEHQVELINAAAPMHDMGKIVIPEEVLFKPGPLSPEEFNLVKSHTRAGHNMLAYSDLQELKTAAVIALSHHEHWDGSGYPHGLCGNEIPTEAQIVGMADMIDTLAHRRAYAPPWPFVQITETIRSARNRRFSARMVSVFEDSLDAIRKIIIRD